MSADEESKAPPQISIAASRLLTPTAVVIICAYGLLLVVPVLISALVVSLMSFCLWTVLLPLGTIAAATFCLPVGFGNPFVTRLVRSRTSTPSDPPDSFIVQLQLSPRIVSGLRALIEDADDVGRLTLTASAMVYDGDAVKMSVPYQAISRIETRNIGWRGLFLYANRTVVLVPNLPNAESFELTERSSWLLPGSRAIGRRLFEAIRARTGR